MSLRSQWTTVIESVPQSDGGQISRDGSRRREELQPTTETWQKPRANTAQCVSTRLERGERIPKKTHLTYRGSCAGQEKCVKCAQMRVSLLFSAFLRRFKPRELAKLVGLQNLFRDLGFFFSLKTFSPPDKSKGVYLEEWEGELGMWKSAGLNAQRKGKDRECMEWKCIKTLLTEVFIGIIFGSFSSCFASCVICTVFTPARQACGLERLHQRGRGEETESRGGWDYFIYTTINTENGGGERKKFETESGVITLTLTCL